MSEIWSGGDFALPAVAHPWLRGDGLFETIKTSKGVIYFLVRHLARLERSAHALLFVPPRLEELKVKLSEAVLARPWPTGRLRLTYFSNGEYLITHQEVAQMAEGRWTLRLANEVRNSQSFISRHKTLSYTQSAYGIRLAQSQGNDDLLYLNELGNVVESGLANILLESNGHFYTPPLSSGLLPGIIRGVLLDWFPEISEKSLTVADLRAASGLYLLSSLRELEPVKALFIGEERIEYAQSARLKEIRSSFREQSDCSPNS